MNRVTPGIRYHVSVAPVDAKMHSLMENQDVTHLWSVSDDCVPMHHGGVATSRAAAWQLALATLRGMIALARIRKSAD